ncbi:RNA 3'-terminal phosphate cyclase [Candidatus Woesearchaeota archaeon]|nr:RNA 3'-terminal phosphate cyclase [Candidatus Woesearchaeota archaeon]
MISLDGNYGEGGGQIVRTALAFSALTQQPFEVSNIRKGRCSGGLKNQHLYAIKALQELCDAEVEGAVLGSERLKFTPHGLKTRTLVIDIKTAGSITLLLQALLLPCFFTERKIFLRITGGTDTKWSMPADYFSEVLLPVLAPYGQVDFRLIRRGYYPAGGGKVEVSVESPYTLADFRDFSALWDYLRAEDKPLRLMEQGTLVHVRGISHASQDLQAAKVAERQSQAAKVILSDLKCPLSVEEVYAPSSCTGSGIMLWAVFSTDGEKTNRVGADALGEKGRKSEVVGKEAAERLTNEIGYKTPVDEYLADNLLPWLALFGGEITVSKITNHVLTNIYVIEQFLGPCFEIDREKKIIRAKQQACGSYAS